MSKIFSLTLLCVFSFSCSFLFGMGGDPMDIDAVAAQFGQMNLAVNRAQRLALDMQHFNINLELAERFWQSREFFEGRVPFSIMRTNEVLAFLRILLQQNQVQQNAQLREYCQYHIQRLQQLLAQHQPVLPVQLQQLQGHVNNFAGGIADEIEEL